MSRHRSAEIGLRPMRDALGATTMSWFRSRSRWGSYLALFALAFQLALTFGHVHLDRSAPTSADPFTVASTDASSDAHSRPADPAGRDHRPDDRCPICTLIHLAGALVPAEPPSLPLPIVFGRLPIEPAARVRLRRTTTRAASRRAHLPPPDIDLVSARGSRQRRPRRHPVRRRFAVMRRSSGRTGRSRQGLGVVMSILAGVCFF